MGCGGCGRGCMRPTVLVRVEGAGCDGKRKLTRTHLRWAGRELGGESTKILASNHVLWGRLSSVLMKSHIGVPLLTTPNSGSEVASAAASVIGFFESYPMPHTQP